MRVLGMDLAWGEGSGTKPSNETGVAAVEPDGRVVDAGWSVGLDATLEWVDCWATPDTLLMVDAPLVVANPTGQRVCERQVGQRYGRWRVSANSTNLRSRRLAGVALRQRLEVEGWRYDDGTGGPPRAGRVLSECYPYTALVGAPELGYDMDRPRYKRQQRGVKAAVYRPVRAAICDDIVGRMAGLAVARPSLHLASHPATRSLLEEPSPLDDRAYKHREDLIDALLCAWTGLLWLAHGFERCQVLGAGDDCPPRASTRPPSPTRRWLPSTRATATMAPPRR